MSEKTDETSASLNELFEMLSHEYRRRVLMTVARNNPHDQDELASKSVVDDHGEDEDVIELLTQRLYHIDYPKLHTAGLIDWDRESGRITRGPRFEEIEPFLRLMSNHQDELSVDWP